MRKTLIQVVNDTSELVHAPVQRTLPRLNIRNLKHVGRERDDGGYQNNE